MSGGDRWRPLRETVAALLAALLVLPPGYVEGSRNTTTAHAAFVPYEAPEPLSLASDDVDAALAEDLAGDVKEDVDEDLRASTPSCSCPPSRCLCPACPHATSGPRRSKLLDHADRVEPIEGTDQLSSNPRASSTFLLLVEPRWLLVRVVPVLFLIDRHEGDAPGFHHIHKRFHHIRQSFWTTVIVDVLRRRQAAPGAGGAPRAQGALKVVKNGFHEIHARNVSRDGKEKSPEATALFRVDCAGPTVTSAAFDRGAARVTIVFSEAMTPSSLAVGGATDAIRLSSADDAARNPQPGTLALDLAGTTATVQLATAAGAWWRDKPVRLEVREPAADSRGNKIASAYETVFYPGAGPGDLSGSFLSGEAYDDETGRPLAGVTARLFASGALLPGSVAPSSVTAPAGTTVTDSRGRYTLGGDVPAGRYALVLEKAGFTRVLRRLPLEPATGAIPFDARLTPLSPPVAAPLDPASGGTFESPSNWAAGSSASVPLRLEIGPNAFTFTPPSPPSGVTSLAVCLTPLSGQGLPELLPLGYTPLAAAEVRLESGGQPLLEGTGTPLAAGAAKLTLPLPNGLDGGAQLLAARYDVVSGTWLTLPPPERTLGSDGINRARVTLAGPGAVAVVVADADAATRPPAIPSIPNVPLTGSSLPPTLPELTGTIGLDPPIVSPAGRSTAKVVARTSGASANTPFPSGLAVQAYLDEKLILSGGGELYEAPFSADLVLYHPPLSPQEQGASAPASVGAMTFRVSPSPQAAQVLLESGTDNIRLYPFPEQLERGQILGPAGGGVTSPDGVELSLPEGALGALASRAVVKARLLAAPELATYPVPQGYDLLAGVRVDLSGFSLARPATLRLNTPAGTASDAPGDPRLVLASWIGQPADGRGAFARLAARVTRIAASGGVPERLQAGPEAASSGLPLEGVVREGIYLVLRAQASIAYATGAIKAQSGFGYANARATAQGLGTADLSLPGGRYTLVVSSGTNQTLEGRHPDRDERGTATIASVAISSITRIDITIQPVPPAITAYQPPNGATNVPVGTAIKLSFSKALDPASVGPSTLQAEIALPDGTGSGVYLDGTLSLADGNTAIVLAPTHPIPPARRILVRFTSGVRDAGGTPYNGPLPVTWSFTTSAQVVTGGQIDPSKIRLYLPVNGTAQIVGGSGALPGPGWSVTAEADSRLVCPSITTVPANIQGGFSYTVGCPPTVPITLESKVYAKIIDPLGGITQIQLGPFVSLDGKGFVASPGVETTYTTVEGITVNVPSTAFDKATLVTVTKLDPASLGVPVPAGMEIGAYLNVDFEGTANDSLRVRLPVVTTAPVGTQVFVGTPYQSPWGSKLRITDLAKIIDGGGGTKLLSNYLQDQPQDPPPSLHRAAQTVGVCPDPSNPCCPAACGPATPAGASCGICPDTANPNCPSCAALKARGCRSRVCQSLVEATLLEITTRGTNTFLHSKSNDLAAVTGLVDPSAAAGGVFALYNVLADLFLYVPPPRNWDGAYILPGSTAAAFTIVRRDTVTGWVLGQHDYAAVTPGAQLVDLKTFDPPATKGPILLDASPFSVTRFKSPATEQTCAFVRLELQACVPSQGIVEIRSTTPALSPESRVTLYNITPALGQSPVRALSSSPCRVDSSGALVDSGGRPCAPKLAAAPTDELLLLVGPGDLDPDGVEALRFQFDRAVDKNLLSVKLSDCGPVGAADLSGACAEIPLDPQTTDGDKQLELRANALFARGHLFQLEIIRLQAKGSGLNTDYKGPDTFVFATRAASSVPVGTTNPSSLGDTDDARDLLKFGNLLLVASATGNLVALDLTAPAVPTVPAGRSLKPRLYAVMSEGGAQARSMATDGHDRVFFAATVSGGSWAIHNLKVEDILKAKPPVSGGSAPCTLPPAFASVSPAPNCFHLALGASRVSTNLGSTTGLTGSEFLSYAGSLPTGIPTKLDIVTSDHKEPAVTGKAELKKFYALFKAGGGPSAPPERPPGSIDDRGFYTFGVNLTVTSDFPVPNGPICGGQNTYRYQRATVDNLTTGQSWSFDIPLAGFPGNPGNNNTLATPAVIRAREGDELRVRFNLRALGYVAIVGGGITVLDLNRLYDTPAALETGQQFNKSQCGKRLASYEGMDLGLGTCAGSSNFDGIRLTPAVAAVGMTGESSCAGRRGSGASSEPSVSVYSPLTHYGAIHSETFKPVSGSTDFALSFSAKETICLQGLTQGSYRPTLRDVAIATDIHWDSLKTCSAPKPGDPPVPKEGDLAFFSLGYAGVQIYDISDRSLVPIGRFLVPKDAAVFRLQVDRASRRLYGGGFQAVASGATVSLEPRIFVWDISRPDLTPAGQNDPRLIATLNAPWDTTHIAIDETGDGLLYTWGQGGGKILPIADPSFLFVGRTRDPNVAASDPPSSVYKPASRFIPLGIPARALIADEVEVTNKKVDDENLASGFKVRVSLPAGMGEVLTAKVQTLTALPAGQELASETVGSFTAIPGGVGWPDRDAYVTLKRIAYDGGPTNPDANDRSGAKTGAGSLYESLETVLMVADPRAKTGYHLQRITTPAGELADEQSQCRRCERPTHFPKAPPSGPDPLVKELLAGGPYVRVFLSPDPNAPVDVRNATTEAVAFFLANRQGYRPPSGVASLTGWADEVPSPTQLSLAEPARNAAMWAGEAGAGVSLVSGEAILQATDHVVSARSLGFAFSRTYRGNFLGYGPLGAAGWNAGLFAHLREVVLEGGTNQQKPSYVDYHDGAGHVWRFVTPIDGACPGAIPAPLPRGYWELDPSGPVSSGFSGGSYCVPYGLPLTLQKLREGGFRLTSATFDTALFDAKGRLTEISDRHRRLAADPLEKGSTVRLFYDAASRLERVEDEFERSYRFTYDDALTSPRYGTLKQITDFSGRAVTYDFDQADPSRRLLLTVKLPDVDYNIPQQTGTGLSQGHGQPVITYAYDPPVGVQASATLAPAAGVFAPNRLFSVRLPAFLPDGVNPDRLRFEYEGTTGRVAAVTVPNALNVNDASGSLRTAFTATPRAGRPAVAEAVRVTPPWNHPADHAIGEGGQTGSIQAGQAVEVFTAPAGDGPIGAPTTSPTLGSAQPKTTFEYKLDGRLARVIGPDGGQVVYNYIPACDAPGVCPILAKGNTLSVTRGFGTGDSGTAPYADTSTQITKRVDNIPRTVKVDIGKDATPAQKTVELGTVGPDSGSGTVTVPIVVGYTDDNVVSLHTDVDAFGQVNKTEGTTGAGTGAGTHPAPATYAPAEKTIYGSYPRPGPGRNGLLLYKQAGDPAAENTGKRIYESYEYDEQPNAQQRLRGNLTKRTTSYGVEDRFKYDDWDRVISGEMGRANALGSVPLREVRAAFEKAYDQAGHLLRERHKQSGIPGWVETLYVYNAHEDVVEIRRSGAATNQLYTSSYRTVSSTRDFDGITGLLKSETRGRDDASGEAGIRTEYTYDNAGRVKSWRDVPRNGEPSGLHQIAYDVASRPVFTTDGDVGASYSKVDALGRTYFEALPTGARVVRTFDKQDRPVEEKVFANVPDPQDPTKTVRKTLSEKSTTYNSYGLLQTEERILTGTGSGKRRATSFGYDRAGRLVEVWLEDPDDPTAARKLLERHYEPLTGKLVLEIDANNNTVAPSYPDDSPWPSKITRSETPPPPAGALIVTEELPEYDALGRVVRDTLPDGTVVEKELDEAGNVLRLTTGGENPIKSFYDGRGLLLTSRREGVPGSQVDYAYDAGGRVTVKRVARSVLGPEDTAYVYDTLGRLKTRTRPGSPAELFAYNSDGTLDTFTTRLTNAGGQPLVIGYGYDPANRLIRRTPNAQSFLTTQLPSGLAPVDLAEASTYDELSRLTSASIKVGTPSAPTADPARGVSYGGYDMRGLPASETVGFWTSAAQGAALRRTYDIFGNATKVKPPAELGVGTSFAGYLREFNQVDDLRRVRPVDAQENVLTSLNLGVEYDFGGKGRLHAFRTLGPQAISESQSYTSPGARLSALTLATQTAPLGSFGYTWGAAQDVKQGRTATASPTAFDLTQSAGSAFGHDGGHRLNSATSPLGSWSFGYGRADELETVTDPTGVRTGTSGPEGRLTALGATSFSYDAEGRRTSDDKLDYTWDWRGRLVTVDVKPTAPTHANEQIVYTYDALGRLLTRLHRGPRPQGGTSDEDRTKLDRRVFVWDGTGLISETGLNLTDPPLPVWRRQNVPGPLGLDDCFQARLETNLQPSPPSTPQARTFGFVKDELGTPLGVLEDKAGAEPSLLARYLTTPYGEVHIESGPELLAAEYDANTTRVGGVQQTPNPTPPNETLAGAFKATTTLPIDTATYAAGVVLERFAAAANDWQQVPAAEYVVGRDDHDPNTLVVMRTAGWPKATRYRVRLTKDLKDGFHRPFVPPQAGASEYEAILDVPPSGTQPPTYSQRYPLAYDSAQAASDTLAGAFPGGQTSLYTGAWTDPVTGLVYLRARWYSPREGVWLEADPEGAVDSENLYAYVGWRPNEFVDPTGALEEASFMAGMAMAGYPKEEIEAQRAAVTSGARFGGAFVRAFGRNAAGVGAVGLVYGVYPPAGVGLGVGLFGKSLIDAAADRIDEGETGVQAAIGAPLDVLGVSQIYAGAADQDIVTGELLGLSDQQREEVLGEGFGDVTSWIVAPRLFRFGARTGASARARGAVLLEEAGVKTPTGRWRRGQSVIRRTVRDTPPTWDTVQDRYWKNKGRRGAPSRINPVTGLLEYQELSHRFIPQRIKWIPSFLRNPEWNFEEAWPEEHAAVDWYRWNSLDSQLKPLVPRPKRPWF